MRATVERGQIEPALKWLATKASSWLLSVSVQDGVLTIESSSDDAWRQARLGTEDSEDGQVKFSAVRLMDQLSAIKSKKRSPDNTVKIEVDGNNVITRVGRSKAISPVMVEIPGFWGLEGEPQEVADLDSALLEWCFGTSGNIVVQGAKASSDVLRGVKVTVDSGEITMHSTDSYRMSEIAIEAMTGEGGTWSVQPSLLVDTLKMMHGDVRLIDDEGKFGLQDENFTILVHSFAGAFRDVSSVIRKANAVTDAVTVSLSDLRESIAAVAVGIGSVAIRVESEESIIVSTNDQSDSGPQGMTEVSVPARLDGLEVDAEFAVSADNLDRLLRGIRTSQVSLATAGSTGRTLVLREFEGEEDEDARYLGVVALAMRRKQVNT